MSKIEDASFWRLFYLSYKPRNVLTYEADNIVIGHNDHKCYKERKARDRERDSNFW